MNGNKRLKKLIIIITVPAVIGTVLYLLWANGALLPHWIEWKTKELSAGSDRYKILLDQKKVNILYDNALIWSSPDNVKVQEAVSCDIDNDGKEELILLCWKIGRYGSHMPFWVKKDEKKWSQHIFVYEYTKDRMKPKWMSSYIGQDVAVMSAGKKADSSSRLWLTKPNGEMSCWLWDSWGFTKEETEVSFAVFGDNLIHEPIYRYGLQQAENFDFLFENLQDVIAQSDIAMIVQETPLTGDPSMYSDYPRFGTPLPVGQAITDAGFDIVACATNHALDKGIPGINTTKNFFDSHGILCLGIQSEDEKENNPYGLVSKNGIRFALLNYTYGTNGIRIPETNPNMVHLLADEDKVRKDIAQAKSESDLVIVIAHWGTEYEQQPNEFQEKWAQVFLECGVDIVVGSHPHTLQPCRVLKDNSGHEMLIYYSLGNFISAQKESSCIKGGMAAFTVSRTPTGCKITEYSLSPLAITRHEDGRYAVNFSMAMP